MNRLGTYRQVSLRGGANTEMTLKNGQVQGGKNNSQSQETEWHNLFFFT